MKKVADFLKYCFYAAFSTADIGTYLSYRFCSSFSIAIPHKSELQYRQ